MGLRGLLDALKDQLENRTLAGVELPCKHDEFEEQYQTKKIDVYRQSLPNASDAEEKVPYILLQVLNGTDDRDKETNQADSTVNIRAIIATFDWDASEGALAVLNLIERIRLDLQREGTVGGRYTLLKPFEYLVYSEDTTPYHIAEISMKWTIESIEQFVPGLHSIKW